MDFLELWGRMAGGVERVVVREMEKLHDQTESIFAHYSAKYWSLQKTVLRPVPLLLRFVHNPLQEQDVEEEPKIRHKCPVPSARPASMWCS